MPTPLDRFIPQPDIRERHETLVRAPAHLVLDIARHYDLQSHPLVHAIFWLRSTVMRARVLPLRRLALEDLLEIGWGLLTIEEGRLFIAGAACRPWQADVVFFPIPTERFLAYAEPECVKIAWTLEAEPLDRELTRFATETRVVATDQPARLKFRRYWRLARFGILPIRWLLLPAVRRQAEREWQGRKGKLSSAR